MLLDREGSLGFEDLPEVLALSRHHSKAGIAAILSERKGLITDVDVTRYLHTCKQQLLTRVEEMEANTTRKEAWDMAVTIQDFFDRLTQKI